MGKMPPLWVVPPELSWSTRMKQDGGSLYFSYLLYTSCVDGQDFNLQAYSTNTGHLH